MKDLYKVLIVDDEGILRNGLKHLFTWEDYGFTLIGEASNGEEALAIIEQLHPHIVITDIVMPIMDGIDLVKRISECYPTIKTIVLSSFSEFKYVREAFKYGTSDYLLKPTLKAGDLIQLLENLCKQIDTPSNNLPLDLSPSVLLNQLLTAQSPPHHSAYEELKHFLQQDSFLLLKTSLSKLSQDTYLNKTKLETSLHTALGQCLHDFTFVDLMLDHDYVILVNLSITDELSLIATFNKLFDTHPELFKDLLFISTHAFSDLEQLTHLYHQLHEAANKSFYFDGRKLVFDSEISPITLKQEFNLPLFLDQIKMLDIDLAKHTLFEYCHQIFVNHTLDEYSFKRFCQNTLYNLMNTLHHLGFDVSSLNQNKIRIFKSIDLALYSNDILDIISKVFENAMHIIATQSDHKNSIILKKVFEYVDLHFNEDITLSDIANKLHLNYYYLSAYFKNHTNENLTAYINKVRVEKSKALLCNPNLSISEVSAQVGFSEHNYFCKVFKKYTSYTPSTYRRKYLGGSHA